MNKVCVRPDIIAQDFGHELVIINGVQDTVCILNETGATIFKALRKPLNTGELIQRLAETYHVSQESIEIVINEYLQELNHQGILSWIN